MKRSGLILLLLSGYVMVCHLHSDQLVRQLYFINLQKSWNDAQQYCRDEYNDLAVIDSSALIQEAQNSVGNTEVWIGLSTSGWSWSQTGPVQSSWFNMWSSGQPGNDECVIITGSGSWSTKPCSYFYYFVCYDAVTNSHILVKNSVSWSDARSYCRQTHTDLSTINNSQDNNQVTNTMPPYYETWIGLYRNWMWSNSSTTSNLSWAQGQPDNSGICATIVGSTGSFYSHYCYDQRPFLCSRDVKSSVSRSVKVRLRAGSADLNDPTLQESILQQVREKLVEQGIREEVKLRWKTQPDGKVFH